MIFNLCKGYCGMRFECKNVNTNKCNPQPKNGKMYLECDNHICKPLKGERNEKNK